MGVADAWVELEQFRLLVLRTAWLIDKNPKNYKPVLKDIAAVKVQTTQVIESIVRKAMRLHGGLGLSWDLPLSDYLFTGFVYGTGDGPTEVHKLTIAKNVLACYQGETTNEGINFTSYNRAYKREEAVKKFTPQLKQAGVDLKWLQRGGFSGVLNSAL